MEKNWEEEYQKIKMELSSSSLKDVDELDTFLDLIHEFYKKIHQPGVYTSLELRLVFYLDYFSDRYSHYFQDYFQSRKYCEKIDELKSKICPHGESCGPELDPLFNLAESINEEMSHYKLPFEIPLNRTVKSYKEKILLPLEDLMMGIAKNFVRDNQTFTSGEFVFLYCIIALFVGDPARFASKKNAYYYVMHDLLKSISENKLLKPEFEVEIDTNKCKISLESKERLHKSIITAEKMNYGAPKRWADQLSERL